MPQGEADLFDISSAVSILVASSTARRNSFRLDASSFLNAGTSNSAFIASGCRQLLADVADIFTVYIQTPILSYVAPFAHSRPYLTTSELGEYQLQTPQHISLLADSRLIEWQVTKDTIILSRSGRVGEAYWIDKKLAGALVGDSFRVVPRNAQDAYFIYTLLMSAYAKNYICGVTYGSVVDHASVDQVRTLPVPNISEQNRLRIDDLSRRSIAAREDAYDLLDTAQSRLLQVNRLKEGLDRRSLNFDPLGQPEYFEIGSTEIQEKKDVDSECRLDAHFYNATAQLAIANLKRCQSEIKTVAEVSERVLMGPRFKRNYVEALHGVPFLSGKNIVQIRPTDLKYLSNLQMADMQELLVKRGWTLITCSGTIGRTCFVWNNFEDYAASQHVLRVIPNEQQIDPGYLVAFLSSPYGYEQICRHRHGSVIDEVTDKQIAQVLVPRPSRSDQELIGDLVREAYEKRSEALRLEDEAQAVLMNELTGSQGAKGV